MWSTNSDHFPSPTGQQSMGKAVNRTQTFEPRRFLFLWHEFFRNNAFDTIPNFVLFEHELLEACDQDMQLHYSADSISRLLHRSCQERAYQDGILKEEQSISNNIEKKKRLDDKKKAFGWVLELCVEYRNVEQGRLWRMKDDEDDPGKRTLLHAVQMPGCSKSFIGHVGNIRKTSKQSAEIVRDNSFKRTNLKHNSRINMDRDESFLPSWLSSSVSPQVLGIAISRKILLHPSFFRSSEGRKSQNLLSQLQETTTNLNIKIFVDGIKRIDLIRLALDPQFSRTPIFFDEITMLCNKRHTADNMVFELQRKIPNNIASYMIVNCVRPWWRRLNRNRSR